MFYSRKKYIFLTSFLIIIICNLLIFTPSADAGFLDSILDPVANFKKAMREWFSELATSFATAAFEYLGEFIVAQTDISKIPNIKTFISWSQWSAGSLVTFFFIKRVVEGLRDNLTGEGEPNFAEMIGSAAVSMALIFLTPEVAKKFIEVNNLVVKGITGLGINVNIAGSELLDKTIGTTDLSVASLHLIFMALIWGISLLVFAIVGALRYVELGIVLIMGPLAASTYVNRSGVLQTYWTETTSVIFTQIAHVVLAYWVIQWSSAGTVWGLVSSIAAAGISIKGPQVLRQFLYSSGAGGALTGASRLAVYKAMMPKVK